MDEMSKGLKKARVLLKQKQFSKVIHQLTPQIFLYRNTQEFHRMLGIACIYTNDFGGAFTYFRRALDIDSKDIDSKIGLGYIFLRRGNTTAALHEWLEIIEIDDNCKQAHKGLEILKFAPNDRDWPEWFSTHKTDFLLPKLGFSWKPVKTIIFVILILGIIGFAVYLLPQFIPKRIEAQREGGQALIFSTLDNKLNSKGSFSIILTKKQIEDILDELKNSFDNYQDNKVRYLINRLLISNAAPDVKTQVALLKDYLQIPSFVEPFWSPEIEEIITHEAPELYENVFIRVSGKVSNLKLNPEQITFDLLVGYETEQVLQAILPVRMNFPVEINGGMNVELIAKINISEAENPGIYLTAESIRMKR